MQYTTYLPTHRRLHGLFYQDFKDTFVCNTQPRTACDRVRVCCFIRISKILLYAIHNVSTLFLSSNCVVLSGFQRYFCMQYTTLQRFAYIVAMLFYQDFKDTFVCNTQLNHSSSIAPWGCFIRISKILLYAIHNWCLWDTKPKRLFYQDFKDTFVCNTQRICWSGLLARVVLSGFQRYFCMQYTTCHAIPYRQCQLFYQDFKDTFVCNTQPKGC